MFTMLSLLTVRLAGSGLPREGRLEVYYNSQWGTVCDDGFDNVDATVACKSLGPRLIDWFLARDSIICLARYMLSPDRLSVCPSHGCIIEKRLKLGL